MLAPLVKKLWPEHSVEELVRIVVEYMDSEKLMHFRL